MPAPQTSYAATMRPAVAGMPATMGGGYDARTGIVESAGGIPFGVVVSQGTNDKGVVIGGDDPIGISLRDITLIHAAADVDRYVRYENMSALTKGDIWVTVAGAVAAGDDVTYDNTTGVLGAAAVAGAIVALPGARWMSSAADGGLAKLRVNLPA